MVLVDSGTYAVTGDYETSSELYGLSGALVYVGIPGKVWGLWNGTRRPAYRELPQRLSTGSVLEDSRKLFRRYMNS